MENDGVSSPAEMMLKDMGQISNTEKKMIEDEIEVLKSRKLMQGVIDRLQLNKEFFAKGRFIDTQYFPHVKSPIKVNFIASDSIINTSEYSFSIFNRLSRSSYSNIANSLYVDRTIQS